MVEGKKKSRTLRRVKVRTPGRKTVTHYLPRNPKQAKCAVCKAELKGMPRLITSKFRNLPKSMKRPTRPYGGNLCSSCMRIVIKQKAAQ